MFQDENALLQQAKDDFDWGEHAVKKERRDGRWLKKVAILRSELYRLWRKLGQQAMTSPLPTSESTSNEDKEGETTTKLSNFENDTNNEPTNQPNQLETRSIKVFVGRRL